MAAWDKKRKVMRHYDRLARIYDSQYAEEQEAKINAALSGVHLNPAGAALDLGCGTGLLFRHIGSSVGLLVGVDMSTHVLKEANKCRREPQNVELLRADADHTPFQNQVFDTLFAITLLQNAPDPAKTLGEIQRIGKQNAVIILTALKKEFTLRKIKQLLRDAELRIELIDDNNLKDHIFICTSATT